MKIAITADVHLKTGQQYPERYNALKDILEVLVREDIHSLIIAGTCLILRARIMLSLMNSAGIRNMPALIFTLSRVTMTR